MLRKVKGKFTAVDANASSSSAQLAAGALEAEEEGKMDDRAKFFLEQWKKSSSMKDYRSNYVLPPPYEANPAVDLPAVARNRERVANVLGTDSAQFKWYDLKVSELQAV